MKLETLERYQVIVYLAAISVGLLAGSLLEAPPAIVESLLWPLIGVMLYATFTQIPLGQLTRAASDVRFLSAAILGNFVLIPPFVWGLAQLLPGEPGIQLGLFLVLLVPCIDWFITFTHLGKGDAKQAIAFSPLSLLLQTILLPFYLWLFLGGEFLTTIATRDIAFAFVGLIVIPLIAAAATQRWVHLDIKRKPILNGLAWGPIPLLACVVFVVAVSQVQLVTASLDVIAQLVFVFSLFLVFGGLLARVLANVFHFSAPRGRVLAFSFGSRNSFVVLPIALALPESYELAVVVIVTQALVELVGMAIYLWWVPNSLFPMGATDPSD